MAGISVETIAAIVAILGSMTSIVIAAKKSKPEARKADADASDTYLEIANRAGIRVQEIEDQLAKFRREREQERCEWLSKFDAQQKQIEAIQKERLLEEAEWKRQFAENQKKIRTLETQVKFYMERDKAIKEWADKLIAQLPPEIQPIPFPSAVEN